MPGTAGRAVCACKKPCGISVLRRNSAVSSNKYRPSPVDNSVSISIVTAKNIHRRLAHEFLFFIARGPRGGQDAVTQSGPARVRVATIGRPKGGLGCRSAPPESRTVGGQDARKGGPGKQRFERADAGRVPREGKKAGAASPAGGTRRRRRTPQGEGSRRSGRPAGRSGSAARRSVRKGVVAEAAVRTPQGGQAGCRDPQGLGNRNRTARKGGTAAGTLSGADRSRAAASARVSWPAAGRLSRPTAERRQGVPARVQARTPRLRTWRLFPFRGASLRSGPG